MSVLKIQELKRQTNLFTNTTVSLRMFTLDNSIAKENLLRKRKRLKTNWLKLNQESNKLSMKKFLKLSKLQPIINI